ncbi:MAG: AAA family ATPase [Thiofilum sp.]|uniref:AAA family ATPase n=1 Tax=Thiofilum sp. TaxID=2212733 RepID=UPI0025D3C2F1|nr:AAA family ATPase [Thiofilum sp.]MBK8454802.1 AAA family ATPase [Thiofilum sp.]
MINFPYGVSNFQRIRTYPYLYLDRTDSIHALESMAEQLLFLRPRRFGKSLLLSTLMSYYDLNQIDQFDTLFGDLAVGKNPTPERNKYMVLQWDFSQVSPQGDIEQIKQNLFAHIHVQAQSFVRQYANKLNGEITFFPANALATFESLCNLVKDSGYQLYLFIDEYDNFANEVLMHNQGDKKRYAALLEGEGILKTLFKIIKAATSQKKIARVFITGVSPVVMSDMTSGYNVVTNISLQPEFNGLCGITQTELEGITQSVLVHCQQEHKLAEVMETMRQFYNGYLFAPEADTKLYNPILCFHFLRHYQARCSAPRDMLDANLAMDAGRIRYIANLQGGQKVLDHILDEQNDLSLTQLASDFGVANLQRVQQHSSYMISLLYYFGVLTLNGLSGMGALQLVIPNLAVRHLYLDELKRQALPNMADEAKAEQLALQFYQSGDLQPIINFMEQRYLKVFSNRDYRWSNELTIKTMFASLLFNDIYYTLDSEAELARRYTDLVMIMRPNMRQFPDLKEFVMEFKFISLGDLGLSAEDLKCKTPQELKLLPAVQKLLNDAVEQLRHYRQVLADKYQEPQRLFALAVVALGFERLVWQRSE